MDIEKLARDLGKTVGTMFKDKKEKSSETINITQMDSKDLFKIILKRLYHDGNFNKAENLIFDELEKNNSSELYTIALDFYNQLLTKNDEELHSNNFSRQEIYQGLEDIKKFKS